MLLLVKLLCFLVGRPSKHNLHHISHTNIEVYYFQRHRHPTTRSSPVSPMNNDGINLKKIFSYIQQANKSMAIPVSNLTAICAQLPVRYIHCKNSWPEVTKPASLLISFRQDQAEIFVTCDP